MRIRIQARSAVVALVALALLPLGANRSSAREPRAIEPASTELARAQPPPRPAVAPALAQVMERVGRYVDDYASRMSLVIGTERYSQWLDVLTIGNAPGTRQLVSEFALVRVQDDWLGFRDVYEVDGKPVSDRQGRLQSLFLESPATAVAQSRRIADEGARYNIGTVQRNFNTPTMALYFVQLKNQARFKFKRAGEEKIQGVTAWKISYDEKKKPTFIRTSSGTDMPLSGTFWVDPADGRVLRSHMQIVVETKLAGYEPKMEMGVQPSGALQRDMSERRIKSSSSVTVSYEPDGRLGLLVPAEMRESYVAPMVSPGGSHSVGKEGLTRIVCRATYSDFKRFETGGRVVVPK